MTTPSALNAGCSDGELLERRVAPRRLVDREEHDRPARADLDRDDLVLEPALVDGCDGTAVRLERVRVERLAREPPLLGDDLGRDSLRHDGPALADLLVDRTPAGIAEVRAHGNAGHVLDAGSDDEVEVAGLDCRGAVEGGLERGAALPVHGRGAHGLGPAGDENCAPPDVQRLLADLGHAAHLHVLDLARVDIDAPDEAVQDLRRELVRADLGQRAVPPPDRRANGVDDVAPQPSTTA